MPLPRDGSRWTRFRRWLAMPVDARSLAVFRVAVGLVMALEAWSLCHGNASAISSGRSPLDTYYTGTDIVLHFPFPAFDWMPMLPDWGIRAVVALIAVAGLLVALGFRHRVSSALLFLGWGYLYVVESTRTYWQSHYYLELLLTFLLPWMPASQVWSLDAWRAGRVAGGPGGQIPFWPVALLRGQLVVAYFYAGVAKLTSDWILDAMPVRYFLREPGVMEPFRRLLPAGAADAMQSFVHGTFFAYAISEVGLVFDLVVGFLLLARRTRILGLAMMLVFHATNHALIFDDIGWFPVVGAATALVFLDPDWPARFARWIRRPRFSRPDKGWFWAGFVLVPVLGGTLGWKLAPTPATTATPATPGPNARRWGPVAAATAAAFLAWLAFQSLLPLRHYAIAGDGRFTYEGMSFSWRLKSEVRRSTVADVLVDDPAVLRADAGGKTRVDWDAWGGERVVHRGVDVERIDWARLPEIVVVAEPFLGERVVFNPFPSSARGPAEARARLDAVWRGLRGEAPAEVVVPEPFPDALRLAASALYKAGDAEESRATARLAARCAALEAGTLPPAEAAGTASEVTRFLGRMRHQGDAIDALRRCGPFALQGMGSSGTPFLLLEDPRLYEASTNAAWRVDRKAWRAGPATTDPRDAGSGAALVVYVGDLGAEGREQLPAAWISDSQDRPDAAPRVHWNTLRELTPSQVLHVSFQPFFLRRYARHVADEWARRTGRRPAVHALTGVALNGRAPHRLVDPAADLASVGASVLRHNAWVEDLPEGRIPASTLRAYGAR